MSFRIFDRLLNILAFLAGALIVFQVVSISADVLLRYFWGRSIVGTVAVNEWSLLILTFLGIGWLQREGGHIRMDFLVQRVSRPLQLVLAVFADLITLGVVAALVWYGFLVSWDAWVTESYDFFKLQYVPIAYILVVIPLGSLLLFIQLLRDLRSSWRSYLKRSNEHTLQQ